MAAPRPLAPLLLLLILLSSSLLGPCATTEQRYGLPAPKQGRDRLLAAITLAWPNERLLFLHRQLGNYVAACEAGFEVHVVLVSLSRWEGRSETLFSQTRFVCHRLHSVLPVVETLWPSDSKLAARHREVFDSLAHSYDFFISQEDDVDIRLQNLQYFIQWSAVLQGTAYAPAYLISEVPTHHIPQSDALFTYTPETLDLKRSQSLFMLGGSTLMHLEDHYPAFFIITAPQLANYSTHPAWTADLSKPWKEFNPHFQNLWLARYTKFALPLGELASGRPIVHHGTNKYHNRFIEGRLAATVAASSGVSGGSSSSSRHSHTNTVEVSELVSALEECLDDNSLYDGGSGSTGSTGPAAGAAAPALQLGHASPAVGAGAQEHARSRQQQEQQQQAAQPQLPRLVYRQQIRISYVGAAAAGAGGAQGSAAAHPCKACLEQGQVANIQLLFMGDAPPFNASSVWAGTSSSNSVGSGSAGKGEEVVEVVAHVRCMADTPPQVVMPCRAQGACD